MPKGRTFTYEVVLQLTVDENNIDMPSTNAYSLAEAWAELLNSHYEAPMVPHSQVSVVNARLLDSREWNPEKATAYGITRHM